MSNDTPTKINQLLQSQPQGVVFQSSWLNSQGYSYDLQKRYRKSRWLESIGTGAMIRAGDQVGYEGAIYSLQKQTDLSVHPGGKTALAYLGKTHYLEMEAKRVVVFGSRGEKLPAWFEKYDWGLGIEYYQTSFLPKTLGMSEIDVKNFSIKVSGAVRAVMECFYLAFEKQDLIECYQLMEGLNNLRPDEVQALLEKCRSVKIKRLFLYLAEKAGHKWFQYLKLDRIDMGSGKRSIVKGGVYISKYQITVPKEQEGELLVDKGLTKLPATNEEKLASELAAIGYPGFSHIKPTRLKDPTEVLLSALSSNKLDARIVEALPWLMLQISELNWKKLVNAAKVADLQNRLGFVVSLARKTAERMGEQKKAESLRRKEKSLADSRLLKEDTLGSDSLTKAEVKWIRQNRTSEAEFWNVLSDLKVEHLSYAN